MKKEIADYIEKFFMKGEPLTDAQVQIIAYWESVDFQCDCNEPSRRAVNKFLEDYNNEMSALV